MHTLRLVAVALLPLIAAAQTSKQTFKLIYASTDQDANEIFTAIRTLADVKGALDSPRQFTVEGTSDQLRTAEWVLRQLDQPLDAPPANSSPLRDIEDRYQENTARVFYLPKTLTPQEFNEIQTAVRTITDIRRVYPYVSRRAIVLRDKEEGVQAAEWLIAEMTGSESKGELIFPKQPLRQGDEDNHVRVYRLPSQMEAQRFNEAQTLLRTLTDTRRVYPYLGKRMIALRGTAEQIDLAGWVLSQLNKDLPLKQASVSGDYTTKSGELVRLFYFPGDMTVQNFNDEGTRLRYTTGIRQAFAFSLARVFAARGTPTQIAQLTTLAKQ